MDPIDKSAQPIIRPLPPHLQEVAMNELNELPDRVADEIINLRQWVLKQQHLCARTNDQFLLSFLRGTKFSGEKAKRKIERYYMLMPSLPEVFNERRRVDDPLVQEILRMGIILQIPLAADDASPCVTIIRAGIYDINKFKFSDIIRVGSMLFEIMMIEDDNASVSGYLEIMDMSHIQGAHLFHLQPDLLRKFAIFADEAMPLRQCGTHFINVPAPFEKGFNTLKSFFPTKMMNRISLSSDSEAIFQFVSRDCLPREYGGTNGTVQDIIDRMTSKMERYRNYFDKDGNYSANEKLREVQETNSTTAQSVIGTFRQLSVD